MNALLLANDLPAIVVNYADKNRYLSALSECNKGDMSSLMDYMIECFYETLEEVEQRFSDVSRFKTDMSLISSDAAAETPEEMDRDPINSAFEEIGIETAEDPIEVVMKPKVEE